MLSRASATGVEGPLGLPEAFSLLGECCEAVSMYVLLCLSLT